MYRANNNVNLIKEMLPFSVITFVTGRQHEVQEVTKLS